MIRRLSRWVKLLWRHDNSNLFCNTIDEIVEAYPRLYSGRQFESWRKLFRKEAILGRGGIDGNAWIVGIEQAAKSQKEFAAGRLVFCEEWDNVEISRYGNIAVVVARYTLAADEDIRTGTDALLLMRGPEGWRIAALVYDENKT